MPEDNWQHRSTNMRCRTCVFFVPKPKRGEDPEALRADPRLGRCRRHAPTLSGWPAVFEADWCGDHKLDENRV